MSLQEAQLTVGGAHEFDEEPVDHHCGGITGGMHRRGKVRHRAANKRFEVGRRRVGDHGEDAGA